MTLLFFSYEFACMAFTLKSKSELGCLLLYTLAQYDLK